MKDNDSIIEHWLNDCWDLMLSDPADARLLAEQACHRSADDSEPFCRAQLFAGLCDIYLGEFESAVEVLNPALKLAVQKGYSANLLRINNALGMSYQSLGRYSAAYDHYEYARELALDADDIRGLTPPMLNLADLFFDMGDIKSSEEILSDILGRDLSRVSEDNQIEACILQTQILLSHVQFDEAERILTQTEARARSVDFHYALLRCKTLRGRMHRLRGDIDTSIQILSDVLDAPLMKSESQEAISVYLELAKAWFSAGKPDQAVRVLDSAVDRLGLTKFSTLRLKVLQQLAFGYQLLGDASMEASTLWEIRAIEQNAQVQDALLTVQLRAYRQQQSQDQLEQKLKERENQLLKQSYERLQMLNDVAHQITMTLNFPELGQRLYRILAEHVDVHFVSLATLHERETSLTFRFIIDEGERITAADIPMDKRGSNTVKAMATQKPVVLNDVRQLERDHMVGTGTSPRSMLFVPLILEDEVLGVFSMQSPKPNRFLDYELELMVALSKFIAIATANILSHDKVRELNSILTHEKQTILDAQARIEHMAYHDTLTTLPNRQALQQVIEERISANASGPFHLVYIDLDGFKPVNDHYGHRHGDRVLRDVAKRVKDALRAGDFAARIGGDEFVLLIEAFDNRTDLQAFLNRLLNVIREPVVIESAGIVVSASIGAARYPDNGLTLDALMHSADQAMYEIKRNGKGGIMAL